MECDTFMQFTQELHPESQSSDKEQIGFLGIQGKTFPLYDGPNKIGRDPGSCSIALDNGTLSRLHAVINIVTSNGERVINLMDIGSRNKTRIGLQVLQNFVPYPLKDGDTVQFGEVHGVFRVLQPQCDFPMTQDFAMTQAMTATQEVPDSPQVNIMKNNLRSNVIVPESPDVSDKDESLIFKSPMLISKIKPNLKSIQAKTLSKKLSDVAISNNFLNNTTKSMICDETSNKTAVRFSNESNKSTDSDRTIVNDVSNEKIGVRSPEESNKSIDSIFQANTQLPNPNSPSIHSLDTQIPTDANKSNDIDIETEKQAFEDSLLNENEDIHIASTQIILKDSLKQFNNNISNINDAETQMFNNSDSNISELQTQVFGCDGKSKELSHLDTQVFGANDVSSADTQVFGAKDLCDAETQMFPKNKTTETGIVIKKEKLVINNADTQFDSRDDEDFSNLNTQILAEDLIPNNNKKEIDNPKKNNETPIQKLGLVDSPDIMEDDDDAKDDFNDLNTQVLEVSEQLTPDLVVPETSETTTQRPIEILPEENSKDNVESKTEQDKDKELLESDDEISFEAFKENDDEQYDISLSQNILGDSETVLEPAPTTSKAPTAKDKTFKSPKPVTPRKKKPETKTVQENVVNNVDIADMSTQIVKQTCKSPAAFEEDEILTQCDISFEDMPTQVLTYEKALEDSKKRVNETLQSISVASLSKKSSGNTSGELENSLSFLSPRKFIAMDLPDSQEIELNINQSSDLEDNMLSDSEQEPNTLENTPILYKSKPKNIKKEKKKDVKKSLDFNNVELPVRVMTRIRKPTARLIDADPQSKKAVENILKPKVSDEVDTDILSENITRLKTKKNGDNDSTLEITKTIEKDVKPKKEIVKRESKRGSTKNKSDATKDKSKSEKTIKTEQAKKDDTKSNRSSSEKTTSKEELKEEIKSNSRTSKRRTDETKQDKTKEISKPEHSKKSAETKRNSDSQSSEQKTDSQNTKQKSDSQNTKQKSDSQNTKQKSDSKSTKPTDKHKSKDAKNKKRRSNSVSSDEVEPKRKRTRLEQKKEDDSNKIHEKKPNTSNSKTKKSDENKIDLTNETAKRNTKTDVTAIKTKEPKKSDRTTRQKDSVKTPTKLKQTKPDLIDLTPLDTKQNTNAPKNEKKIKGILKNVNQIDNYFVKDGSPQNRIELRKRPMDTTEVDVKKRRVDSQRTSNNKKDVTTYKVLFTAFNNEEVKKKLVELGAVLVTEIKECDVLVTVQIKRTFKLLCAVGLGMPIVGPQWVQQCVDTGGFVDPWQYVIQDAATETKFKFNLKATLRGKRNFLRGYKVSSTPSVNPKEEEMKQIVECSGGKWGTGGRKWLCVTSMLDKHAWPSLETKGATLLHVEFILHGALTQSFNVDSYKLTGK